MKKSLQFQFVPSSSKQFTKCCKLNSRTMSILSLLICLIFLQCSMAWQDDEIVVMESKEDNSESNEIVYTPEELEYIVSYGEDCSSEGPFCDARQHLACDNEEEICVCDDKNGYVHMDDLSEDLSEDEEDIMNIFNEADSADEKGTSKKICMKASDLEYKMDRLLNITKKIKDFADIFRKYKKYLPKKYQDLLKEENVPFGRRIWKDPEIHEDEGTLYPVTSTGPGLCNLRNRLIDWKRKNIFE